MAKFKHLIPILILFCAGTAFAHTLERDGSVGAVMHVDPGDQPLAGELATFGFEVKDTTGRLDARTCECVLSILFGGSQIYSENLYAPSARLLSLSYVFPTAGVYVVEVAGTPAEGATFDTFRLVWDLRVEPSDESPGWLGAYLRGHVPHLLLVAGGFFFVLGVIIRDQLRVRRRHTP